MAKKNYSEIAQQIIDHVGGSENIDLCFHCATRLRLILKDFSKADIEGLKSIDGVVSTQVTGDQLQVIIGQDVGDVYTQVCKLGNIKEQDAIDEHPDPDMPVEKNRVKAYFTGLMMKCSAIFSSILEVLCAAGLIKALQSLLLTFGILSATSGEYIVLNALGDALFYSLPFFLGYSTAKENKIPPFYGMLVAAVLMYPTFLSQTSGATIHFLFFDIKCYAYSSTVLPVILSVILFAYVYKLFHKIVPKDLSFLLVGFLTCLVSLPVILAFIAPIGDYCGELLSTVLGAFFTNYGPLAGAVFTGLCSFYVMSGMHHALVSVMIYNFTTLGYDYFYPGIIANNVAVAGAVLGYAMHMKDKNMKSASISNGLIALVAGVSEPALYGVAFKYRTPLIGIIIGGAAAGAVYMMMGVKCYVFGSSGLLGFAGFVNSTANLVGFIVMVAVAFIVSFIVSYISGAKQGEIK